MTETVLALEDARLTLAGNAGPVEILKGITLQVARGETVDYLGTPARRHAPLDFMAVTDHAEYMGFLNTLEDPASELANSDFAREYREL